ncbi:hypothetical protein [Priestia megaterium]|uniref:hypothetical protein n=1 Tax=Priestia megaterium TaxID=1404 RepID=UPI002E206464|nr:hypothetical protein [Priestia megaterium]MED4102166.1 hypothetical protein [Priestia megaterium]MED4142593.1 hypothetical protein [Priestia megaterium]
MDPFIKKWTKRITVVMVSITILFWVVLLFTLSSTTGSKGPLLLYGLQFTLIAAADIIILSLLLVGFRWFVKILKGKWF